MSSGASCVECGRPLLASARRGVCPYCALRATLELAEHEGAAREGNFPDALAEPGDHAETALPFRKIGDYELIEGIGRGGMGVIFKARQRGLDRIVALKLIRAGSLARPADIARFRTEAAAAARLHHPNIVAIYEVGEEAGRHFYSMEFVPGHSLARELTQGPFGAREAAILVRTVADAIQFAHENGVLHRDLKPSNILLDAERNPRVSDFGLAKLLRSDSELTLSGAVLGSPNYMPPEQARGRSASADARSDVYSLGAILYELITGHSPFSAPTPLETMKLVAEQDPVAPRALNADLPRDLETICLKCLAKEPAARYPTARDLADELGRFLRSEPIRARPVGAVERLWRWCRRKPALAALGAVLAIAPVVIISVLVVMSARVAGERNRAVAQEKITRESLYAEDIAVASRALDAGDFGAAWRALTAQMPSNSPGQSSDDMRGFEWRWLWHRVQGDGSQATDAHLSTINAVAFSPDGRFVISASSDGTAKLWDASSQELLRTIEEPDSNGPLRAYTDQFSEIGSRNQFMSASFSADGGSLLTAGSRGVSFWDLASGQRKWNIHTNFLTTVFRAPANTNLALARPQYPRTNMAFIDLVAGQVTAMFGNIRSDAICLSPDGRLVARWDRELRRVFIHTVPDGKVAAHFNPGKIYVIDMAFTPDGKVLALGNYIRGSVELYDLATYSKIGELTGAAGRLRALAISPDGRLLGTGGHDQTIHLWDLATRRELRQLHGHRSAVYALAFSPDSQRLASGGYEGTVRFWELAALPKPPLITNAFGAFAFSSDGSRLITQDTNGMAHLWELPGQRQVREWSTRAFQSAVFENGQTLILADAGDSNEPACVRRINLAEPSRAIRVARLRAISAPCSAIALSADGIRVATAHANATVAIWDAGSGELLRKSEGEFVNKKATYTIETLAFAANGQRLAAASFDYVCLKTWDIPGLLSHDWRKLGGGYPVAMAISPDGQRIASGGSAQGFSVNIWADGRAERDLELRGHLDTVVAAAFAPDGRTLATGGADGSLKFWHLATRRDMVTLALGEGVEAAQMAFSPDGTWLGVADKRGMLHLFHAPYPAGR